MYPTRQCIANRQGDVSIVSISRAITIGTPQEDVALSKFTSSDNEIVVLTVKELENHPSFLHIIIWVILQTWLSTTPSGSIPSPPRKLTDSPSRI